MSHQNASHQYGYRYMYFRNGALTFTDDFYNRRVYATIYDSAHFTLGADCNTRFGWGGAENQYTVKSGGQFDAYGTISIGSLRLINEAGGLVNFAPSTLYLWEESDPTVWSSYDNSGTMNFPYGMAFTPSTKRSASNANETRFLQKAGTMTFGGPITIAAGCYGSFTFNLSGGTLVIGADVAMTNFASVGMTDSNTTATIDIAAGKTLDWSNATFAEGTTLNLTGSGTIILGLSFPTTLNRGANVTVERTLRFIGAGLTVNELAGWEDSEFVVEIDFEHCPPSPLFTSSNAGILAKYFAALEFPAGWSGEIQGSSVVVTARPPMTFCWLGKTNERDVTDPAYWSLAESEDAARANPYDVIPAASDFIYYGIGALYKKFFFEMGGESVTVAGFAATELNWNDHQMSVRNGTLTFANTFSNRYIQATIKNAGKLVIGAGATSRFGFGSALNSFEVQSGGELVLGGTMTLGRTVVTNGTGGTVTIDPVAIGFAHDAAGGATYAGRGIFNSGTMAFPHGLDVGIIGGLGTDGFHDTPPELPIRQIAGTLSLGGDIAAQTVDSTKGEVRVKVSFSLEGGALDVTNNVAFSSSLEACEMVAGATASATIAEGKTLDVSCMQFSAGTTLNVSGGTFVVGLSVPETLALAEGTTVRFAAHGLELGTLTGFAGASFEVADSALTDGAQLVLSSSPEVLTAIAGKLVLPDGWDVQVSDGAVWLTNTVLDRPSFSCSGEVNLSNMDCWEGPAFSNNVPVYVSGAETVAILDDASPSISKITVRNGATLKIAAALDTLPELEVVLDAKIVIASGVTNNLPAIGGVASATQLPIVEIATGAVVTVAADYEFKNVRLDFFGELKPSGNVWFGTADVDETAYFGMRWIGGTLNYAGDETLSFVCPKAAGGRVVCTGGIYLKHAKYLPPYSRYYSFNVGYLNPQNEPFEMVIDGCYLDMRGNRQMCFGGAAAVKCVNGGGFYKPDSWRSWGLYGRIYFQDNATLELDGDSYVYYVYNQIHTVSFSPATANAEQLILKNGSYFAVHTPVGNSEAAVRVEDAYYDVMGLQTDGDNIPQRSWYYDVFNGFSAINVPAGKFFCIRSSEVYNWGAAWDRELAIGAPIAGGGALVISNATSLADVKARLVRQYGSAAPEHFATARGYGMRAIVKLGTNTATGEAKAVPCEQNCQLVFADGSNWAGTLIADEHVAFTNLTDAAAPASATFGTLKLTGKLPIRVWKNGQTTACDSFTVTDAVINVGGGAITPVPQDDYEPQHGDSFALGRIPAAAELPAVKSDWVLTEGAVVDGLRPLTLTYSPKGLMLFLR